jgi:uncharacterized membrane protein
MSDWYYAADNTQKGPINESELKAQLASSQLPSDTLVWKDGMSEWTPATQVPAFSFRAPPEPARVQPPNAMFAGTTALPRVTQATPEVNNPDSVKPVDLTTLMGAPESLEVDQTDVDNNKIFGILAYLGPMCFIPIIVAKESPFAKYHANQGLVLFLLEVVILIVLAVLDEIIYSIFPGGFARVLTTLALVLYFAPLILFVLGVINAAAGKCVPLPYVGGVKLLK